MKMSIWSVKCTKNSIGFVKNFKPPWDRFILDVLSHVFVSEQVKVMGVVFFRRSLYGYVYSKAEGYERTSESIHLLVSGDYIDLWLECRGRPFLLFLTNYCADLNSWFKLRICRYPVPVCSSVTDHMTATESWSQNIRFNLGLHKKIKGRGPD